MAGDDGAGCAAGAVTALGFLGLDTLAGLACAISVAWPWDTTSTFATGRMGSAEINSAFALDLVRDLVGDLACDLVARLPIDFFFAFLTATFFAAGFFPATFLPADFFPVRFFATRLLAAAFLVAKVRFARLEDPTFFVRRAAGRVFFALEDLRFAFFAMGNTSLRDCTSPLERQRPG